MFPRIYWVWQSNADKRFADICVQQVLHQCSKYSLTPLEGPSLHWVPWGREALVILCPLQDPEVLAALAVLEVLQILRRPGNKGSSVTMATRIPLKLCSVIYCLLRTLGPSGPGAPGWPCGPGFPALPVSPCEPLIPGTPGTPGGPTDPGWPCRQKGGIC